MVCWGWRVRKEWIRNRNMEEPQNEQMQQIHQRRNDDAVMMMMINHSSIYLHPSVDGSLAAIAWYQKKKKKEGKNENKIRF